MFSHYTIASHRNNLSSERHPVLAGTAHSPWVTCGPPVLPTSIFVDRIVPFVVGKGAWSLKSGRGKFEPQSLFYDLHAPRLSGLCPHP